MSNIKRKSNGQFDTTGRKPSVPKKAPYVPVGNRELGMAMLGLRLSSAATPQQDTRTQRNRTRSDQNRNAIRDQLGN